MIVNDSSSIVNKWIFKLIGDPTRVVIFDHHQFIIQATGLLSYLFPSFCTFFGIFSLLWPLKTYYNHNLRLQSNAWICSLPYNCNLGQGYAARAIIYDTFIVIATVVVILNTSIVQATGASGTD